MLIKLLLAHAYQAPFIRSLTANFCSKMVCLIDQVHLKIAGAAQLKISDSIRRIVLIASALFSLVALGYWIIKNSSEISKIFANQLQTPATLASEIDCAKQDFLNLNDSDFDEAESAKLFLVIQHGANIFSKTAILPQDVNKERVLEHFDTLFIDIQDGITFNPTSKTKVDIGILAKGKDIQGQPAFSFKLTAHTTVHRGETSDFGRMTSRKVLASNRVQDTFCDLLGIARAPQLDAQDNFI